MATITLRNPINTSDITCNRSARPGIRRCFDRSKFTHPRRPKVNNPLKYFPGIDTGICAAPTQRFNQAATLTDIVILCVSMDLPFALNRFCGAEGLEAVKPVSVFRSSFGSDYGVTITDGPLAGLLSRAVVVINAAGNVVYTEQVPEIAQEPDYDSALAAATS